MMCRMGKTTVLPIWYHGKQGTKMPTVSEEVDTKANKPLQGSFRKVEGEKGGKARLYELSEAFSHTPSV